MRFLLLLFFSLQYVSKGSREGETTRFVVVVDGGSGGTGGFSDVGEAQMRASDRWW